jgi:pimeloyl-ACP methyl ester carboxylesterase
VPGELGEAADQRVGIGSVSRFMRTGKDRVRVASVQAPVTIAGVTVRPGEAAIVVSSALYAAGLPHKVRAGAVRAIFESMVELSDHGNLLDRFLGLPMPKMLMYGEQNSALSYLPALAEAGVELAPISHSAHFPMYANAPLMWARIAEHVARAESRAAHTAPEPT